MLPRAGRAVALIGVTLNPRAAPSFADSSSSAKQAEVVLTIVFVAIAVASQAWQPFRLGFYHDDWGLFVQPRLHAQDIHFFGTWQLDRPGFTILNKLLLDWWDGGTATLHLVKIAFDLLAAAGIGWTILVYQKAFGSRSVALAAAGAAFWLAAPWSLGYSLWPTAAFTNPSIFFFCLSAVALARWVDRNEVIMLAAATAAFGAAVFYYQSPFFAVFPFALVLGMREWWSGRPLRPTIVACAALGVVQLGSVALSLRYSPKTASPNIVAAFAGNLKGVLRLGVDHFGKAGNALLIAVIVGAAAVAVAMLWRRGPASRMRAIASLLLMTSGVALTSALYASADYGFVSVGLFSRTTQMLDFWLAIGGAILLAPPLGEAAAGKLRYGGLAVWLIVVGACALAYWPAAKPWVESWELQRAILDKSGPLAAQLRDDDIVLADVPLAIDGVVVFGAPWDITGGVLVHNADRRPDLAHEFPTVQIVPPLNQPMSWTPGEFTINPSFKLPGKRLLLWRWQEGIVATVDHAVASRAELIALLEAAAPRPQSPPSPDQGR
jgi:hypothetical protein